MKKVLAMALAAGLMLVGTQAKAQLSVGAGYINSDLSGQYNGHAEDRVNSTGFYGGASLGIPITGWLAIAPGAYFTRISNASEDGISIGSFSHSSQTRFVETAVKFPLMARFGHHFTPDAEFFAYAGPIFQLGLSSKTYTDSNTAIGGTGASTSGETDYFANNHFKKNSLYVGGGIGALYADKVILTAGYESSVMNLYGGTVENTSYRRANVFVGVGYVF